MLFTKRKYFNHIDRPPTQEIQDRYVDLGRQYQLPDGEWVYSVTTIIGTEAKEGIEKWKKKIGNEKAEDIIELAATKGTLFHEAVEDYLNNKPPSKTLAPFTVEQMRSARPTLNRIDNIWYQENALYSSTLGTAGRVDCIAEFDGVLSIIDFKTARKDKKEEYIFGYKIQTAVYSRLFFEMFGVNINNRVIIIQGVEPTPQVFQMNDDIQPYIDHFLKLKEQI